MQYLDADLIKPNTAKEWVEVSENTFKKKI